MPTLALSDLPRYLFAPYVAIICYLISFPKEAPTVIRDLSIAGLIAISIGGVLVYYAYRAVLFPFLQAVAQFVQKETPHKFIDGRYQLPNGASANLGLRQQVLLGTMKDIPAGDRVIAHNSAVHGFFQSAFVCVAFSVVALDLSPKFPPVLRRVLGLMFGPMRPAFPVPFGWRTRWA